MAYFLQLSCHATSSLTTPQNESFLKVHPAYFYISLSSNTLFPQESNVPVTGRVTDVNQQPIPLVNIKVQETDLGTLTDVQGEYTIDAYPGDKLLFSHIGMEPVEVRVKRDAFVINVRTIEASIEIEEVEIRKNATFYPEAKLN